MAASLFLSPSLALLSLQGLLVSLFISPLSLFWTTFEEEHTVDRVFVKARQMDLNGRQVCRSAGCCVCTRQYASGLAECYHGSPIRTIETGKAHAQRDEEEQAVQARFKRWKSLLCSTVPTLQSINTSLCFSCSLSRSHSVLLSFCQQCMTNEYKTPSGCIHLCVPPQLMMFILS